MKKIAFFIIIILFVFSCGEDIPFEHKISESNSGQIFIYNSELPPVFEIVIADGNIYHFQLKSDSRNAGYWQDLEGELPRFPVVQTIQKDDLEKGWYFADINEKKRNTPDEWMWIKSGEVRAYVDKMKVMNFIEEYGNKLPDLTKRQPAPLPAG